MKCETPMLQLVAIDLAGVEESAKQPATPTRAPSLPAPRAGRPPARPMVDDPTPFTSELVH